MVPFLRAGHIYVLSLRKRDVKPVNCEILYLPNTDFFESLLGQLHEGKVSSAGQVVPQK